MKDLIPNQLFNQPGNFLLFEKHLHSMTKKLLSMLVFVCIFAASMSAQEARIVAPEGQQRPIMALSDFLATLHGDASLRTMNSEAARIKSLVKDSHPAVYVESGVVKRFGDQPVSLFTNVRSMGILRTHGAEVPKSDIEIVTIKISNASELSSGIDLSLFSDFPNLKYIYIVSGMNSTPSQIINAIHNNNPNYSVFYDITNIN
jgi:hypothetical protein